MMTHVSKILETYFKNPEQNSEWIMKRIKNQITETINKNLTLGWCKYDDKIVIGEFEDGIPHGNAVTFCLDKQYNIIYICNSMYVKGEMSKYASFCKIMNIGSNKEIKTIKKYFQM